MKIKILISVFIASLLCGCNSGNRGIDNCLTSNEEYVTQKIREDSIKRETKKQLEIEILSLKKGILYY